MRISTLLYSLKQGLLGLKRNKLFSLASISTIAACIFLIGVFYSVSMNFQFMVKQAESTLSITVFFDEELTESDIFAIGDEIRKRPEVANIEYTSGEQAWENFKESYFTEENMHLAEGFKDNPLAKSASYKITINDAAMHEHLVRYLETTEGIRKVNASQSAATALGDFGNLVAYISMAIILVLFAVGVFLISNTIMIGITVRKNEIGIMKLIGATDFFVRAPFVIEGVIIGLIGAGIPLVAIYTLYDKVVHYISGQFITITSNVLFMPRDVIFKVLIPLALLIGAGIGVLGSRISIKKHLKI